MKYGTLGFTPEMSTCEAASDSVPDDEWLAEDCVSGFIFPDDEELIQAEFEKNIPFALSVAKSAHDPDDPVSALGIDAPDLVADPFAVSYGRDQQVAVTAKRSLRNVRLNYSINGGRVRTSTGGGVGGRRALRRHPRRLSTASSERRSRRTLVTPSRCGSPAAIAAAAVRQSRTEPFTYTVHDDIGGDVLVLAAEDVTGMSPAQGLTSAQYVDEYASSLEAAGYTSDVYDFDVMGRQAPHHLGVLSHYDGGRVGDRRRHHPAGAGPGPGTTAEAALDLELSVRDYLNEGGKLPRRGQVRALRSGGERCVLVQPVPAAGVHDAAGVSVPAAAQRLPAVLAGRLRERQRRRHRSRHRRAVPADRRRGRVRRLHRRPQRRGIGPEPGPHGTAC